MILDVDMPERNGIESAEYIRGAEKAAHRRSVPIVGMTGYDSDEVRQLCLSAGMNEVISKPIGCQLIVDLLKKLSLKP